MAGVEQANLITKEIYIDLIDFIYPADIHINDFRTCWAKYGIFINILLLEWENRISLTTNIKYSLFYLFKAIFMI